MKQSIINLFLVLIGFVSSEIYFYENFHENSLASRWVESTEWKDESDMGEWGHTAGKWTGDKKHKGIQTKDDLKFYAISAKLDKEFTNEGKDLVLQFSVKHEQDLDCGGGYVKLLGDLNQKKFGGDSTYQIMFGPDICGTGTRRTHVIFTHKDENLLLKKEIKCESDRLSHLYTLHIKQDGSYEVFIDQKSKQTGQLEEDWAFLAPKQIKDPNAKKPSDWDDREKIVDEEDVKPEGYDDIPAQIPDDNAEMPDDWDAEEDGEWEAPMIDNPAFKGKWKPKMIKNPSYQGKWVHPMIDNPEYVEDLSLPVRCKHCTHIGFELWQVKSGTIFSDILVTDSIEEANEKAKFWTQFQKDEKEEYDEMEDERKAEERESRKKNIKHEDEDDEDDDDEDHDEF